MCDTVYNLTCVNKETSEIRVECVKSRDFEPVPPFHIQGRPYIDKIRDFGVLVEPGRTKGQAEAESLKAAIEADLSATFRKLEAATGIGKNRIRGVARKVGFEQEGGFWVRRG